jgi:hypothetical protein
VPIFLRKCIDRSSSFWRLELAEVALLSETELDLAVFRDLLRPNDESQITAEMAHVKETSSNYALHSSNTHPGIISTIYGGQICSSTHQTTPDHSMLRCSATDSRRDGLRCCDREGIFSPIIRPLLSPTNKVLLLPKWRNSSKRHRWVSLSL